MLQYLINVTKALFPVAMILSLMAGFLFLYPKSGRNKIIIAGAFLGVATAAVVAVIELLTGAIEREYYSFALLAPLSILIIFAGFLTVLSPFSKVLTPVFAIIATTVTANYTFDVFFYPSQFAVGMDNIYNTDFIFKVTGFVTAFIIIILLSVSLYKISKSVPKKIFLAIFNLVFISVLLSGLLSISYILLGRDLIPRSRHLFTVVFFASAHNYIFNVALFFAAFIAFVTVIVKNKKRKFDGVYQNNAAKRKDIHVSKVEARWCLLEFSSILLVCLFLTVLVKISEKEVQLTPPVEVFPVDEQFVFPLSEFEDGHLRRYNYKTVNGVDVRFIIIKKPRAGYGVGLDACDICGPTGYYERKGQVVCIRCDVVMNIATIGFEGGCNPVPLKFTLREGSMYIAVSELEKAENRFS
jgi:uncharacterized membrane protein